MQLNVGDTLETRTNSPDFGDDQSSIQIRIMFFAFTPCSSLLSASSSANQDAYFVFPQWFDCGDCIGLAQKQNHEKRFHSPKGEPKRHTDRRTSASSEHWTISLFRVNESEVWLLFSGFALFLGTTTSERWRWSGQNAFRWKLPFMLLLRCVHSPWISGFSFYFFIRGTQS